MREGIALALASEQYSVLEADGGEAALAAAEQPDIVILDIRLPDMDGFEVCRRLRFSGSDVPVIFLTARAEEIDRVAGLEIGADDYVVKPFSLRKLRARLRVQLRHRQRTPSMPRFCFGDIEIDFGGLRAMRKGHALDLTPREFEILQYFARRIGATVTREELLSAVWKVPASTATRTVDTHILKLRKKIEPHPNSPRHLVSIWGEGYGFLI